ncbi:MAG: methyltransferase [Cyanobacteria bacterium P01_F01_bin.150]
MLTTSLVLTSWLMDGSVAYSFPVSTHRASQLTWSNPIALVNILSTPEIYRYKDRPSSDGIGKFYMGREIAQVMGHLGASWLERPSRIQEEKPHVLMANLDIQPTDVVADIGAGTGYLTARLAPKVPQGKVLAVDVQPEMLEMLGDRIEQSSPEDGLDNVELILASEDDPHLPMDAVDMAIMLDVYHELAYPYEVMQQVVKALRPGGKMVLVEYRGENPLIPIKRLHKMTEKQARKEMKKAGLNWMETSEELPRQHLMVFEKT